MASFQASNEENEDEGPPTLSQYVDELTDKGKAKRASAIAGVLKILRSDDLEAVQASLSPLFQTLLHNLKGIVRKASGEELVQVSLVISVLGLCLNNGPDGASAVEELLPVLVPLASTESSQPLKAEQALQALGGLMFLCNEEDERLREVMTLCEANLSGFVADEPKVAALRSWGLLLPLLDVNHIQANANAMVAMHAPLLTHESLDVRVEAAENLAMLKELLGDQDDDMDVAQASGADKIEVGEQGIIVDNPDGFITNGSASTVAGAEASAASASAHERTSADDDVSEEWLDELTSNFIGLSADGGSAKSKRDAKEQRARLKTILAYVQEEEEPQERLTLDKLNVPLTCWLDIKRVAFAKEALRDGFNSHLKTNPVLHQVLGLHDKDLGSHLLQGRIVNSDERSYFSRDKSKAAALSRNKARRKREAVKDQFMSSA